MGCVAVTGFPGPVRQVSPKYRELWKEFDRIKIHLEHLAVGLECNKQMSLIVPGNDDMSFASKLI